MVWENGVNTRILLHKENSRKIQISYSNYIDNNIAEFSLTDSGLIITKILKA